MVDVSLLAKFVIYMIRYLTLLKKIYKKIRYGDIEKVLNNCYKIIEKENEIKDIIADVSRDGLDWIFFQIRLVGKLEILDRELDELITEFCASITKAKVEGDAKIYSEKIKEQFEEMYKNRKDILRNYNNLVDIIKKQIENKVIDTKTLRIVRSKMIEKTETKIEDCRNKVKRDIRMLKELHDN